MQATTATTESRSARISAEVDLAGELASISTRWAPANPDCKRSAGHAYRMRLSQESWDAFCIPEIVDICSRFGLVCTIGACSADFAVRRQLAVDSELPSGTLLGRADAFGYHSACSEVG